MSPPKLAADAPVFDLVHPMAISLSPALGIEFYSTFFNGFSGSLDARIFHEPLLAEIGFDRNVSALAITDVVDVILDFQQQLLLGQFFDNCFASFHSVQTEEHFAGICGHS